MRANLASSTARWLLLSDVHFRPRDLDRITQTAQWIASLPQRYDIRRVVICGDLLTSRTTQSTQVLSACYRFLGQLSDQVPHVNVILGNHDLAYKREYATSALDALHMRRLAPFVTLHADVATHTWDGRRVLTLPFREDQRELTTAVSGLDPAEARETVGFAHLALNKAVMQRHIIDPLRGQTEFPYTYRGMTGPANFASLARTFTGHFHSYQTIVQDDRKKLPVDDAARLEGSVTYLGAPHQLTWSDACDEQRGVVLLDPDTLSHELVLNPHGVHFITVPIEDVLRGRIEPAAVEGKDVMLLGNRSTFQHATARDTLLSLGVHSVRNWNPMAPYQSLADPQAIRGLGATMPAQDTEAATSAAVASHGKDPREDIDGTAATAAGSEDLVERVQPLDFTSLAEQFLSNLTLSESLEDRRDVLLRIGHTLIQHSTDEDFSMGYNQVLASAAAPTTSVTVAPEAGADARHVFNAKLQSLTITNFLGIRDTVSLDLRTLPHGLAFVIGANGAGKSTLFEALVWCQFGRCMRAGLSVSDVINDDAGRDCSVSVTFENGYNITRYRKHREFANRVVVSLHGKPQPQLEKGEARATQEALEDLLGTDYDTYVRTVVLGPESAAGFLGASPTQRRDLIESTLGLSAVEHYGNASRQMLKELDSDKTRLENEREALRRTMKHIDTRVDGFEEKQRTLRREDEKISKALVAAQGNQEKAERRMAAERDKLQKDREDPTVKYEIGANLSRLEKVCHDQREQMAVLGELARKADLRIAVDRERLLAETKVLEKKHQLRYSQAALVRSTKAAPPASNWQGRLVSRIIGHLDTIQHRLRLSTKGNSQFGDAGQPSPNPWFRRVTASLEHFCLGFVGWLNTRIRATRAAVDERQRQQRRREESEALEAAVAASSGDLHKATQLLEKVTRVVAERHGVSESHVIDTLNEIASDRADAIKADFGMAAQQLAKATLEQSTWQGKLARYQQKLDDAIRRWQELKREQEKATVAFAQNLRQLQDSQNSKRNDMVTYKRLVEEELSSRKKLADQLAAMDVMAESLATARELFAFWESAFSKRRSKESGTNFRGYALEQSLEEVNSIATQILAVLYEDTRHTREVASGMLRSLFAADLPSDDSSDADSDSDSGSSPSVQEKAAPLLDGSLGVGSSLAYAKRSGGERKRIDLALFFALLQISQERGAHRARYILVDEVFDSLDSAGQAVVVRWCRHLMSRLDFVAVVTHSELMVKIAQAEEGDTTEGASAHVILEARRAGRGTEIVVKTDL